MLVVAGPEDVAPLDGDEGRGSPYAGMGWAAFSHNLLKSG